MLGMHDLLLGDDELYQHCPPPIAQHMVGLPSTHPTPCGQLSNKQNKTKPPTQETRPQSAAKRTLQPTHSQARHARSIAAALEAASARGAALQTVPDAVVARLQQFAAMNAFKREARRVVATYLPEEEVCVLGDRGGRACE